MKNSKITKRIFNAILFLLFVILTFYIVLKDNNIGEIINNIKNVNVLFIGISVFSMFIFISCEGINIRRVLKTCGCKISLLKSFKYALVGFFFSSITPSASGGDPAQLYFMSKDKLPVSHSALALLVELSSFQFVSCTIAIIGFIYNYDILINNIGNIKYLLFLGLTLNIIILLCLLVMIFSKKFALKFMEIVCKILNVFHYKKVDEFMVKFNNQIEEYHKCSLYLKNNKLVLCKIIMTTSLQMILYHSIPYFVYLSFGLKDVSYLTFIFMEAVLYISVSSLPFPGAMGVSEGGFMIMFKMFFPMSILSSAMLISRGISFYLFVIISGILITIFILVEKCLLKKVHNF